ncbi:MAG: hypothetical protein H6736_17590 [Alphaproteobacteria bacterium]|nr:hypothetical protein [Alphaproteobacteria bacterium]
MIALLLACATPEHADVVLDAPGADPDVPFGDPAMAANGADGAGCCAGGTDVYSLTLDGRRPHLVLGFSGRAVVDGPGPDLVVFENAFDVRGGGRFMDPVVVGVSADGERFVDFPHAYLAADPASWSDDPEDWQGFAGVTPTLAGPDGPPAHHRRAGGDRFDLADLPEGPERTAVLERGVIAIRLVPAGTIVDPATGAPHPVDPVSDGPDIDAVYAWSFGEP